MLTSSFVIGSLLAFAPPQPAAAGAMTTYQTDYYVLETDLPEDRAKAIGKLMDATGKEYFRRFQGFSGKVVNKPKLKVYSSKAKFDEGMKTTARTDKTKFMGGFFNEEDETVYSYEQPAVEQNLRHECFHQFVYFVIGGDLSPWTNEGLAEYFGDGEFDAKTSQLKLGNVTPERAETLRVGRQTKAMLSIEQLMRLTNAEWLENMGSPRGKLQYAQAWALCHFLIHAEGGRYQPMFDKYLKEIDRHVDGESAFKKVFGADMKPLQAKYDAYVDQLAAQASKAAKKDESKDKGKKQGP